MRFAQDPITNVNLIRSYAPGELKINQEVFRETMIVAASVVRADASVSDVAVLGEAHAARLLEMEPEVVLIGSGRRQSFPPAQFGARFLTAGIGFEVMDTGAACRTFNVLVGEQRRVVALLIP